MLRGFFRGVLVLAALLVAFVANSEADWHWYYKHVHQHYAAMTHYHQAMQQHAAAVHEAQAHQLAQVHHLTRAHVAVPPIHHAVTHELEHRQRQAHVTLPAHSAHWHHTRMHHQREVTIRVYWPRLRHGHGHIHPYVVRTVHERRWKTTHHGHVHRPPQHYVRTSREVIARSRARPAVPGREHHLAEKKTAVHKQSRDEKSVVVRSREKVHYEEGKKEWDIYLLLKVYYWTDDTRPRALPKHPTKLPTSLPGGKPALPRALNKPPRETPVRMALAKPPQPLPRSLSRPKAATPLGKTMPRIKLDTQPPLELDQFIPMTTERPEEPDRRPAEFPPVQRARKPAARPNDPQREMKPAAEKPLALAIPRAEQAFPERRHSGDVLLPAAADLLPLRQDGTPDRFSIARERDLEEPAGKTRPEGTASSQGAWPEPLFPVLSDAILLLPRTPEDAEESASESPPRLARRTEKRPAPGS